MEKIFVTKPLLPSLEELIPYIEDIWDKAQVTNHGRYHDLLQIELKTVLKVNNVSLFNNGTIALLVALKALDLPMGSEVITTPFTFPATPHCISWNGLKPVFCDIEPEYMTIDAEKIESLITNNTSAILGVHVYGHPCNVSRIEEISKKYNLKVIYDSAHAFSTEINGRGIGTFGDISMFSFHATKLFHTIEGGCLTYNSDLLKEKIYYLRNFGIKNEEEVVNIGINGKLNELQATVGLLNLKTFQKEQQKRVTIREIYSNNLHGINGIVIPKLPNNTTNSQQYFVIRIIDKEFGMSRDMLYDRFRSENIYARKYFYPLCSDYAPYKKLASRNNNLEIANKIKDEVLCLPFYGELETKKLDSIISVIIDSYGKHSPLVAEKYFPMEREADGNRVG